MFMEVCLSLSAQGLKLDIILFMLFIVLFEVPQQVVFHLVGELSLTLGDDIATEFDVVFVLFTKLNP